MSVVVPATETPGPGAPGAPRRGRWVRAGWALGLEAAAGGVDRQAAPTGRWVRAGVGIGAGSSSGWTGQAGSQEAPLPSAGPLVRAEQLQGHGHCPVPGAGVQPRPAQPCPSPSASGLHWCSRAQPLGCWPRGVGPLSCRQPCLQKKGPSVQGSRPPVEIGMPGGDKLGHSHGDLHRHP